MLIWKPGGDTTWVVISSEKNFWWLQLDVSISMLWSLQECGCENLHAIEIKNQLVGSATSIALLLPVFIVWTHTYVMILYVYKLGTRLHQIIYLCGRTCMQYPHYARGYSTLAHKSQ